MTDNIYLFKSILSSIEESKSIYESNIFHEERRQFFINLYENISHHFLEKCNLLESQKKEKIDKKYHNEFFYETIKRVYIKYKYHPNIAYLEYAKSEKMNEFIECFEQNDNKSTILFLDEIPISDREEIIIDILKWGQKYYRGKIFTRKVTDKRKINRDIKQFNEAQKFIESFLPRATNYRSHTKEINKQTITTSYTDYEGIPYTDIFLLEDIVQKLIQLQDDLKTRDFKIFPREYYLDTRVPKKEELKKIFEDIAKKYKLKGIKQIKVFLPFVPSP